MLSVVCDYAQKDTGASECGKVKLSSPPIISEKEKKRVRQAGAERRIFLSKMQPGFQPFAISVAP